MPEHVHHSLFVRRYPPGTVTQGILRMKTDRTLTRFYICLHVLCNMLYGFEPEPLHVRRAEGAASSTAPAYLNQTVNCSTYDVGYLICVWLFPIYYPRQFLTRKYRFKHCWNGNFTLAEVDIINIQFAHSCLIC